MVTVILMVVIMMMVMMMVMMIVMVDRSMGRRQVCWGRTVV
jgi:hypothetical protein